MIQTKTETRSLAEVHETIDTTAKMGLLKKLLSFLGPAYLVSVGYMDPGNWATDLAGGSRYGYTLIWVLLMSNLIALLLQSLSARLGIVRSRDLAQASREIYPPFTNFCLYILAEIAIAACDLAEVLGMAIGLQLLFHLPITYGVIISVLDSFLLLFLLNYGMRKLEALIISLVVIIGGCFFAEMIFAQPVITEIAKGFIPSMPDNTALYIAIGIIGATVMPHNLYLHSALVQSRKFERTTKGIKRAIRFNVFDSAIALNLAFLVNSAILILAAAVFYKNGMFEVAELQDAHRLLEPMMGNKWAPILFAVALIAAGQSSTITGTLAGQIVMEGYLNLRISPWLRRLITRLLAVIPALIVIYTMGEKATGSMLVLSQVILSLQLGFAIIPLIHFNSDKEKMGKFVIPYWMKTLAWMSAVIIVGLNVKLVYETLKDWITASENPLWLWFTVVPVAAFSGIMLIYITVRPVIRKKRAFREPVPHHVISGMDAIPSEPYQRIAITVDFSTSDERTINHALAQGGKAAKYLLVHVVETAGALMLGKDIKDYETGFDTSNLQNYCNQLQRQGYTFTYLVGYGNAKQHIPEMVNSFNADLLVMGAHGHKGLKDLIFGTTLDAVRHKLTIPVLIVQ